MNNVVVKVDHVSKTFLLPHEKHGSLKSTLINLKRAKKGYEKQQVLNDVSFEVKKGEFFGIVGRNGSGKSTLLKLLAGIYNPDKGTIQVNGKLTPFIELGVGFNPELSGRENVFLNGALLGFNRKEVQAMYDNIVEFAELDKFMDQKLKNYSSGMQVRLAFSIAIQAKSDILLLDEVLAVGDAAFQRKCFDYFMDLKKNNQTVLLVTHDMSAVRQYCDKAIMVEAGQVVFGGEPELVAQHYQRLFNTNEDASEDLKKGDRWGVGGISAKEVKATLAANKLKLEVHYVVTKNLEPPVFGFTIYGPSGVNILESNTMRKKVDTKALKKGDKLTLVWEVPRIFADGTYNVSVACCDRSLQRFYDWFNNGASFTVKNEFSTAGLVDPSVKISTIMTTKERQK